MGREGFQLLFTAAGARNREPPDYTADVLQVSRMTNQGHPWEQLRTITRNVKGPCSTLPSGEHEPDLVRPGRIQPHSKCGQLLEEFTIDGVLTDWVGSYTLAQVYVFGSQ